MVESRLQDARQVTQRLLCVGALLYRRQIELSCTDSAALSYDERDELHDHLKRLQRWMLTEKLMPHLTQTEQELLEKPLAGWAQREVVLAGWRVETLGILSWALCLTPHIPTFDTRFTYEELDDTLDILTPTIDLLWRSQLRPVSQLYRMRDTAELWDWRCRASELQRLGVRPSQGVNYQDVIRVTAEQAHADGTLPTPIEGDFPAFGKAFAQIGKHQYDVVRSIAAERYQAMCWLTEASTEWESLPVDL